MTILRLSSSISTEEREPRITRNSDGKIIHLDLSGFHPKIPDTIARLQDLLSLRIERTNLGEIPKGIFQLKSLEVLNLRNCNLKSISGELRNLEKLETLILSGNNFESLPDVFNFLLHLRNLILDDCYKLNHLPESIKHLKKLEFLDLSKCREISNLPIWINELTSLKYLDIRSTKISEFPLIFRQIEGKGILYLGDVNPNTFPDWFFDWFESSNYTSLKCRSYSYTSVVKDDNGNISKIDFQHESNVTHLPKSITNLKHLKELNLGGQKISDLSFLHQLKSLEKLNIDSEDISVNLEELIRDFPNLKKISVRNLTKPITQDFILMLLNSNITILEVHGYDTIFRKPLDEDGNISKIEFKGFELTEFPDFQPLISEGRLESLTSLQLRNNKITEIPDIFENLPSLKYINLSHNPISNLPPSFQILNPISLNLDKTNLEEIPRYIAEKRIQELIVKPPVVSLRFLESISIVKDRLRDLRGTIKKYHGDEIELDFSNQVVEINAVEKIPTLFPDVKRLTFNVENINEISIETGIKLSQMNLNFLQINDIKIENDEIEVKTPNLPNFLAGFVKTRKLLHRGLCDSRRHTKKFSSEDKKEKDISFNKLPKKPIDNLIQKYEKLEELELEDGTINQIPDWIGLLPNLTNLKLYYVYVNEFPEKLLWSKSLKQIIIISRNYLKIPLNMFKNAETSNFDLIRIFYEPILYPEKEGMFELEKGESNHIKKIRIKNYKIDNLSEIPFSMYPEIEEIELKGKFVESIPDTIKEIKTLKSFKLQDYALNKFPNWFWKWIKEINLKHLILGMSDENRLKYSESGDLIGLDLSNLGLNEFPPGLEYLDSLENLNLQSNNIVQLPDWIDAFKDLKKLNVSKNQIKNIPNSLQNLPNLIYVDFSYNQITTLEFELFQSKSIQFCDLSLNPIKTVKDKFWNSVKDSGLRELYLGENDKNRIVIDTSGNIHYLDLSLLNFNKFPDFLKNLPELKRVDLRNTNLVGNENIEIILEWVYNSKVIDFAVGNSKISMCLEKDEKNNIIALDLRNTNLSSIPKFIQNIPSLELLILRENQIHSIPSWIQNLPNLKYLDLSLNPLDEISEGVCSLVNLESLLIHGIPFQNIKQDFWKALSKSNIQHLIFDHFLDNRIGRGQDSQLNYLDLSRLKIDHIPTWVQELQSLKEFDISFNEFKSISDDIISWIKEMKKRDDSFHIMIDANSLQNLENKSEVQPFFHITFQNRFKSIKSMESDIEILSNQADALFDLQKFNESAQIIDKSLFHYSKLQDMNVFQIPWLANIVQLYVLQKLESFTEVKQWYFEITRKFPFNETYEYHFYKIAHDMGERAIELRTYDRYYWKMLRMDKRKSGFYKDTLINIIFDYIFLRDFNRAKYFLNLARYACQNDFNFYVRFIQCALGSCEFNSASKFAHQYGGFFPKERPDLTWEFEILLHRLFFQSKLEPEKCASLRKEIQEKIELGKKNPRYVPERFLTCLVFWYIIDEKPNQAYGIFKNHEELCMKNLNFYLNKAMLSYLVEKNIEETEKYALKYYHNTPWDNRILDFLGEFYLNQGNLKLARLFFSKLTQIRMVKEYYSQKIKKIDEDLTK